MWAFHTYHLHSFIFYLVFNKTRGFFRPCPLWRVIHDVYIHRIFDQFEPITEADLNPAMIQPSIPLIDRSVQTTPLPEIPKTPKEAEGPQTREQTLTWQWPRLRSNDTYRVIKKVRDAQASNTYGFAYYNQLSTTELVNNKRQPSDKHPTGK